MRRHSRTTEPFKQLNQKSWPESCIRTISVPFLELVHISKLFFCNFFLQIYAPAPKRAQELFLWNFLVNFSGSTAWKVLLFVNASAFNNKAVHAQVSFLTLLPSSYATVLKCPQWTQGPQMSAIFRNSISQSCLRTLSAIKWKKYLDQKFGVKWRDTKKRLNFCKRILFDRSTYSNLWSLLKIFLGLVKALNSYVKVPYHDFKPLSVLKLAFS